MEQPAYSRERVRGIHRALGEALDELSELSEEVIRGRTALVALVDRRVRELRQAVAKHHALESQAVLPVLARGNGWGVILARHLAEVHRHQLGLVERAAGVDELDPVDRAVRVRILTQALRDDLHQEARWMALLPDDA